MHEHGAVFVTVLARGLQYRGLSIICKSVMLITMSFYSSGSLNKEVTNLHEDSPSKSNEVNFFLIISFIYLIRPTPIIYWIKEDGTLPINRTFYKNFKKTLQIIQVSEADSGNYQCIAKNSLGAIHHTISVTVKGMQLFQMHGSCLHEKS